MPADHVHVQGVSGRLCHVISFLPEREGLVDADNDFLFFIYKSSHFVGLIFWGVYVFSCDLR